MGMDCGEWKNLGVGKRCGGFWDEGFWDVVFLCIEGGVVDRL